MRRLATRLVTLTLTLALAASVIPAAVLPAVAAATPPRASLTDIEQDVMCVVCKEPLAVAQSAQADRERAFITTLINQGLTKAQIEHQLVVQYGPSVLALPPANGFNLTVYILPPAVVLIGAALLAYTIPRWRRRTRANSEQPAQPAPALQPAESQRLDEELARFGR
jgi:cytochrome c-type biogenesis protein CcmH/NrfF